MNANDRCKQHSQGDRCRKPMGHEGTDPVHEGQFTIWQHSKFREEKFARKAPKRNRVVNRFVRQLSGAAERVPVKEQARFIGLLGTAIKALRGA